MTLCVWWGAGASCQMFLGGAKPHSLFSERLIASMNQIWCQLAYIVVKSSSSSHMRVINHNWSATKQRLYPQSSRDKPPFSFVRGQDSTMWDIVWVSLQGHRSVSVSRHFLLQAPQCPCSVQKRFSGDLCCWGRSKPGCRIVGSHTRWELTTWADFQLCLHRLLMSTCCKSSHNGFLDVSRSNDGLRISGWIGQLSSSSSLYPVLVFMVLRLSRTPG